ncbi:hypothetical protein EJB05_22049, partial [Eragrostis curvula]
MASLLGLYSSGGPRRAHAKRRGRKAAWRSSTAAPVRQLLKSLWRRGTARPSCAAVRFAYDPQSYAQNFDDGLGSSCHRLVIS